MAELSGTTFKGYDLQEKIGVGGFGVVYRAVQSAIGREVAIKIILPEHANKPDFIRRFESEAQLVARLEHIHIVPLYDYWRDPNGAYLVMRYLRKGSLKDILKQGALDLDTIAVLLDQIASALSVAHRGQVIHRDIKPANILLDDEGNAYLADFGIAKNIADSAGTIPEEDAYVGSPDYLAPEQARNEQVTSQTDIYSLGLVLYEMLTGEHPFPQKTPEERLFSHLNEPVPEVTTLEADVKEEINAVIQKATSKDPVKRYADVMELAVAFREAAALGSSQIEPRLVELLTPREQQVLKLIVKGKTNREIADTLYIEVSTVKSYIKNVYRKLNVRSRVQAIVKARDLNLIVDEFEGGFAATTTFSHLPPPENPYKGLRAFTVADEHNFFGRERIVTKILKKMDNEGDFGRFLAVVGPSGSGKSSLVKAGLIPALWRGELKGAENWFVVDMVPGMHPLDELEVALMRIASDQSVNLRDQLIHDEQGLIRSVDELLPDDDSELLIVIDQFEEVFTLVEDEHRRTRFLALLHNAVTDPRSRVRVLITMRADFYGHPLGYPQFGEMLRERMETVLPLGAEELERAIIDPARQMGVGYEEGLVASIISDVNNQPGTLPLLQYALTELFEMHENRILTHTAYQEIGGAVGALATRAEEVFSEFGEDGQEVIRQLFMRLVTLGEGVEDTRRRVGRKELVSIASDVDLMDDVIDTFAAYRLLSLDNDPASRRPMVEVAHEALLREWKRLRDWLDESRNDIRIQRQLARTAGEWQEAGKDPSFLLRGARLEHIEDWHSSTELALTRIEQDFLDASVSRRDEEAEAEKERKVREIQLENRSRMIMRVLLGVLFVASLVSGGLALSANNQRNRAERQASILLASQAESELEDGFSDRAILLALEALENYPYTAKAEYALGTSVSYNRVLQQYDAHLQAVTSVDWSPDGEKVASISVDNTIHIWDAISGETLQVIELPTGITGNLVDMGLTVKWTPDGQKLVTLTGDRYTVGSQDFDIQIWDVPTGEQLLTVEIENDEAPEQGDTIITFTHYTTASAVEFSPDGHLLATLGGNNTALIWDANLETIIHTLNGHENDVNGIAWSPDGAMLVTASEDGTARIWDATNGETLQVLNGGAGRVNIAVWSPDGAKIATAGEDGIIRFWDPNTGEMTSNIAPNAGLIWRLRWSPDGEQLISGQNDGNAMVWDVSSGELVRKLVGSRGFITDVDWSPVGDRLAVADGSGAVRIWNVAESTALLSLPYRYGADPSWSSDGRYIAYAGGDFLADTEPYHFNIWDVDTGALVVKDIADEVGYFWFDVEFSPDDSLLIARGGPGVFPNTLVGLNAVRMINAHTGELVSSFNAPNMGESDFLRDGAWSPDGKFIAGASSAGIIYIWDRQTGKLVKQLEHGNFVNEIEWSPDGEMMGSVGIEGYAYIWDTQTWEILMTLSTSDPNAEFLSVEWSPDGSKILMTSGQDDLGSTDTTARIWDSETGELLLEIVGHTRAVNFGEWSPDGTRIVTASSDGTTRVWDATTGAELLSLSTPVMFAPYGTWSPDGKHIAVGGIDMASEVWRVWQTTEELIDYAYDCCVFRELTSEEREQFGLPPVATLEDPSMSSIVRLDGAKVVIRMTFGLLVIGLGFVGWRKTN